MVADPQVGATERRDADRQGDPVGAPRRAERLRAATAWTAACASSAVPTGRGTVGRRRTRRRAAASADAGQDPPPGRRARTTSTSRVATVATVERLGRSPHPGGAADEVLGRQRAQHREQAETVDVGVVPAYDEPARRTTHGDRGAGVDRALAETRHQRVGPRPRRRRPSVGARPRPSGGEVASRSGRSVGRRHVAGRPPAGCSTRGRPGRASARDRLPDVRHRSPDPSWRHPRPRALCHTFDRVRGGGTGPGPGAKAFLRAYARYRPMETDRRLRHRRPPGVQRAAPDLFAADDLTRFELRGFSQNGEDGVLVEILNRIGVSNRFFVEFGIQNGTEGNCVLLADVFGWAGVFIEADDEVFAALASKYDGFRGAHRPRPGHRRPRRGDLPRGRCPRRPGRGLHRHRRQRPLRLGCARRRSGHGWS